jgi:hypothetical protein
MDEKQRTAEIRKAPTYATPAGVVNGADISTVYRALVYIRDAFKQASGPPIVNALLFRFRDRSVRDTLSLCSRVVSNCSPAVSSGVTDSEDAVSTSIRASGASAVL